MSAIILSSSPARARAKCVLPLSIRRGDAGRGVALIGFVAILSLQACVSGAIQTGTGGATTSTASGGRTGSGGAVLDGSVAGGGVGGASIGAGGRVGAGGGSGGGAGRVTTGASGGTSGTAGQPGVGGQTNCPGRPYDAASPPTTLTLSGNLGAHDPAAIVVGGTIYLAATGLTGKTSTDLMAWQAAASPLARPAWVTQMVPGATNLWAPDISSFGGMYHLYYAASTFGSNKSCIGHATRAALDSGSWADHGSVICSNMGTNDNWNAIDPNVVIDDAGTPWLAFGSFWGGLKMVKLDSTGVRADTTLYSIAARPNAGGALEGSWVFKRCGYYYLFSSWGACCNGALDYNIRVGRSTAVTGPYVDKAGVQLMQGGGTSLVQGNASWVAPGHNAVIVYGGNTYNIYHALKGGGAATLRISELVWDGDGWPVSGGP